MIDLKGYTNEELAELEQRIHVEQHHRKEELVEDLRATWEALVSMGVSVRESGRDLNFNHLKFE